MDTKALSLEAVLAPLVFVGIIVLLVVTIRMMVAGARRNGAAAAETLGLVAEPGGWAFAGTHAGVAVRLAPNGIWQPGERPGQPGTLASSSTGQIVVAASLPQPLPFGLRLQGVPGGGREHLPGRLRTGDHALDAMFSLLTTDAVAAQRLLADPAVQAALFALAAKHYTLFDVDDREVVLQSGHYRRTVELVDDATALARVLAERGARV